MSLLQLLNSIRSYWPNPPLEIVEKAYLFAQEKHDGQIRASGEPYFVHLEATATIACALRLDVTTIASALLHDVIEDTGVTRETLQREFGDDIAAIVDGVTKLTRIEFESREQKQAESFRKMLIAMAKDMRVVLVKLCDRLHNMRTLSSLSEQKRRRIAKETEDIYAPIANRLGMHGLKSELEDLCLLHLRPEIYHSIELALNSTAPARDQYIHEAVLALRRLLEQSGISAAVSGRAKHIYSVWKKVEKSNIAPEEVPDLLGFRVIVPSVSRCYEALGVIHGAWKPIFHRFKDYIAFAKPNNYQSIHTTVIGPSGHRVEVQIRTPEMHRIAEEGIAAHWRYKEQGDTSLAFDLRWVKDLVDSQQYLNNSSEFIQSVKTELFPEAVFVFTPKSEPVRLPHNATPIDFAYAVHSDIGHHASGAKVNGQMVPLSYKLSNGDVVEILTSSTQVPRKDWLRWVQSSKAKQRIRAYVRLQERTSAVSVGAEALNKELKKTKASLKKLEKEGKIREAAEALGFKSEGELYAELGYGKLSLSRVIEKIVPPESGDHQPEMQRLSQLERIRKRAISEQLKRVGVKVSGLDNVYVRFAKCCEPLAGDPIVGFTTRGRGVTIHFRDCAQMLEADPQRVLPATWDGAFTAQRKVKIALRCRDRMGLLQDLSKAIADLGANIVSAQAKTSAFGKAMNLFEIAITDARQLEKVKRALEMVPGVTKVERLTHMLGSISLDYDDLESDKE
jgi:GTP diphosphokinase / guanosine-3',5'-bis(diphosphate) 3'-diphosphatase